MNIPECVNQQSNVNSACLVKLLFPRSPFCCMNTRRPTFPSTLSADSALCRRMSRWSCQSLPHHTWSSLNADEPLTNCFSPGGSPKGKTPGFTPLQHAGGVIYKDLSLSGFCCWQALHQRSDWVSWSIWRQWCGKKRLASWFCIDPLNAVFDWQTPGTRRENMWTKVRGWNVDRLAVGYIWSF